MKNGLIYKTNIGINVAQELVEQVWEKGKLVCWYDESRQKFGKFLGLILDGIEQVENEGLAAANYQMRKLGIWPYKYKDKNKRATFHVSPPVFKQIEEFKTRHTFRSITAAINYLFCFWIYRLSLNEYGELNLDINEL